MQKNMLKLQKIYVNLPDIVSACTTHGLKSFQTSYHQNNLTDISVP